MVNANRSKLVRITVRNIGCLGNAGVDIELDDVVCLVGKNNAGKSTILRAYELAKGGQATAAFDPERDRCLHAQENEPSEVILEVHIPDGIGNIDNRWKTDRDGLRIVKSRWQWAAPAFTRVRTTWDPEGGDAGQGDWAAEGNASGLDSVFSSRLPRPLRIGSLDDAQKTENMLLTLALTPLVAGLESERANPQSDLAKAIASVSTQMETISAAHEEHFNKISQRISAGFRPVFPRLDVTLKVGAPPLAPKVAEMVKSGSSLRVTDGAAQTTLSQQGTGARRALFWAMLQVHNELSRDEEIRNEHRKRLEGSITAAEKKIVKAKTDDAKQPFVVELGQLQAQLAAHLGGAPIPESEDDPALPGYLLLIDEPENALHPMAARAAQRHLYKLAQSPDWQVIMTTHSPYFINPFEDHTTIVRLERTTADEAAPVEPKTYRSDLIEFEGNDKQRLQALQHIDPSFSEVFFGSYPVLVEGDTEHAAFMASILELQHELIDQMTIIRARGKAILVPLIKVLAHFKMSFGIVHDADSPFKKNGDKNGMWTENRKIRDAVVKARESGVTIRHRVSVPDFERFLGGEEESKDKPLNTYLNVTNEEALAKRVQELLGALALSPQHEPFEGEVQTDKYLELLEKKVRTWATENGLQDDVRFKGK